MAIPVRRAEQIAALTAIVLLAAAAFAVLRPFVAAILWALVIAIATWPAYERLLKLLGARHTLAATLMLLGLAAVLVVPLAFAGIGLSSSVPVAIEWGRSVINNPPPPPAWLLHIPIVGDDVDALWRQLAARQLDLGAALEPYVGAISRFLLGVATAIGSGLFQLGLSLLIVFFLFRDGDAVAAQVRNLVGRVAGSRAERLLREAHGTMTGVLYGILGTALIQGALTAFGLWLVGVPTPFLLGALAAAVAPLPMGVGLVIWPTAIWLALGEQYGAAIFVFVWGIVPVGVIDNVLRPVFVQRSSRLPFVLVLLGLIGGALVAGVVGLFLGPVVLAVAYALVREWAVEERAARAVDEADESAVDPAGRSS